MGVYTKSIKNRINGFDELRGIAVIMVLVAHWGLVYPILNQLNLGRIGVDIFFVISGFLIGKILSNGKGDIGYYRNFYVRRIFRILPLAIVIICLGVIANSIFSRNMDSLVYYFTFTQNFIPAFRVENLGVVTDIIPLIGTSPMWSLAVEEQIYILIPVLYGCFSGKCTNIILLLLSIFGVLFSLSYMSDYASEYTWYTNYRETWARMHYITVGCLLSNKETTKLALLPVLVFICGLIAIGKLLLLWQVLLFVIIIYLVVHLREERMFIKSKLLKWVGERCFGIYLIHYPIVAGLKELLAAGFLNSPVMLIIACLFYLIFTMLLAYLSFKYFEMPMQRMRTKFERL